VANWPQASVVAAIPRRPPNSSRLQHSATRCNVPAHRNATHYFRCACANTRADTSSNSRRVVRPRRLAAEWS